MLLGLFLVCQLHFDMHLFLVSYLRSHFPEHLDCLANRVDVSADFTFLGFLELETLRVELGESDAFEEAFEGGAVERDDVFE